MHSGEIAERYDLSAQKDGYEPKSMHCSEINNTQTDQTGNGIMSF
ncbi:MAG TPA: hypothetical protein VI603_18200 [Saprospiraceae bacterium]|nr:hypothetical protein [Saprospiraceae bacterium]